MNSPRDPEPADQTLVPGSPTGSPASLPDASAATPVDQNPYDATLVTPSPGPAGDATLAPVGPAGDATLAPRRTHEATHAPAGPMQDPTLAPGTVVNESQAAPTPGPAPAAPAAARRLPAVQTDATLAHPSAMGIDDADDVTQMPPNSLTDPAYGTLNDGRSAGPPSPAAHASAGASKIPAGPKPPSPGATGTMVGRFALQGLHAKGGLGEVFTARDTELNREVAVKRIQSRYADDPSSRRRFLSEAEITARLDHPGVVPVFGLVSDGFGRPCYAMRFIRGETLKDEIDRYHDKESGARATSTDKTEKTGPRSSDSAHMSRPRMAGDDQPRSIAFRHLLQRFIAVCQAIGYAHTRRVIHRDIKPANVMVGSFGETLVVDWGLAKALDDGPDADRVMRAIAEAGYKHDADATEMPSHMTMAGTAVGTPAYMPPEQAEGRLELVGTQADVYSLGATLYAILTGKAPFTGSTKETLEKVRKGEFAPPRAVNPEVSAPLNAVCVKAMALRPEDRYATAIDLATDVERWMSDEPVSCHRDPFLARAARWARRHPARIAAGVSLLLAGVLAAGVVAWAINEGRKNTQTALGVAETERDKATKAEKETAKERDKVAEEKKNVEKEKAKVEVEKKNVESARDVAANRYKGAVKAFNKLVTDIQKQLSDREGTQEFRANLLREAQKGLKDLIDDAGKGDIGADLTLVAAHRQMGEVYLILGKTAEAAEEYKNAVRIATQVLTLATPKDQLEAKRDLGRSLLDLSGAQLAGMKTTDARVNCEKALAQFREVLAERRAAKLDDAEARADVAAAESRLADIMMQRGETKAAADKCEAALQECRALARDSPDDLAAKRRLADSLGRSAAIALRVGRSDALATAQEALEKRKEVAAQKNPTPDDRRDLATAYAGVAEIHLDRGSLPEAAAAYTLARQELAALLAPGADPKNAAAKAGLAAAHRRLSLVALRTGDLDAALADARAAQGLAAELHALDARSARARRELGESHEQVGDVLIARGKAKEAVASFKISVAALALVESEDPESAQAKFDLARAREHLGLGYLADDDPAQAVKELTDSVALRERVHAIDPESARAKREYAAGLGRLAEALTANKSLAPAADKLGLAVALLRGVVGPEGKDPAAKGNDDNNVPARRELAGTTGRWGDSLHRIGRPTLGLTAVGQSLDQYLALEGDDKDSLQAKADVAAARERLAALYAELGQTERAMVAARDALNLRKKLAELAGDTKTTRRELADAMTRFADTYAAVRQYPTAREWYASARKLVAPDENDVKATESARRADAHLALVNAIEAVERDPDRGADNLPAELRVPALRRAMESLSKDNLVTTAGLVAAQLAAHAKSGDDQFAAARTLAKCATSKSLTVTDNARAVFGEEAMRALAAAAKGDFRDADALNAAEWNAFRKLPEFLSVQETIKSNAKKPN